MKPRKVAAAGSRRRPRIPRRQELVALFTRCDCCVSLHRAEGYGLTLAEATALGKPVVATGFSGNTDS